MMQVDRQKALDMLREYYSNESLNLKDFNKVKYAAGLNSGGTVDKNGVLLIGKSSFERGPEYLASVVYHESVHYEQGWHGSISYQPNANSFEAQAYYRTMQQMRVIGFSYEEYGLMHNRHQFYCGILSSGATAGNTGC